MKKVLFALCALLSIASLQAKNVTRRSLTMDNDLDGKQATTIRVQIDYANKTSEVISLHAGTEQPVRFPRDTYPVNVTAIGVEGAGAGQSAQYRIPPHLMNKRIKVDADLKRGRLMLSYDPD